MYTLATTNDTNRYPHPCHRYSASKIARDEFPDIGVEVRGAISKCYHIRSSTQPIVNCPTHAVKLSTHNHHKYRYCETVVRPIRGICQDPTSIPWCWYFNNHLFTNHALNLSWPFRAIPTRSGWKTFGWSFAIPSFFLCEQVRLDYYRHALTTTDQEWNQPRNCLRRSLEMWEMNT